MAKVQHISGRRWFERTNGNTYHTTTLHFDDGSTETSPIEYGYGEGYLQTAFGMMGLRYTGTRGLREDMGISWSVADVNLKRDLVA